MHTYADLQTRSGNNRSNDVNCGLLLFSFFFNTTKLGSLACVCANNDDDDDANSMLELEYTYYRARL